MALNRTDLEPYHKHTQLGLVVAAVTTRESPALGVAVGVFTWTYVILNAQLNVSRQNDQAADRTFAVNRVVKTALIALVALANAAVTFAVFEGASVTKVVSAILPYVAITVCLAAVDALRASCRPQGANF